MTNQRTSNSGKPWKSLRQTHPELVQEFHPTKNGEITPDNITAGTKKRLQWICKICSHEWATSGSNRTNRNSGCGYCNTNRLHSDGRNSMRNTHPEIAKELHPTKNGEITPDNVVLGTHKKLHWQCWKCSHEWVISGKNRAQGDGCIYCARNGIHSDGRNSMKNTHPELAEEFHETKNGKLTIENTVAGTKTKLWWKCKMCSNEWKARGADRVLSRGCSVCNVGVLHSDKRNSMEKTHPEIALEFHPTKNGEITPSEIIAGTSKKLHWICSTCSHEWISSGSDRTQGYGCSYCNGSRLHSDGRNSLRKTNPELALLFHPIKNGNLTPDNIVEGTHQKIWWNCNDCDNIWASPGHNRRGYDTGCPECNPGGGFNPNKPGFYYSMSISGPDCIWWYKGGISHEPETRKRQIENSLSELNIPLDITILQTLFFQNGEDARNLETKLLRCTRIRASTLEKFSGSSELFTVDPIDYAKNNDWI